MEAVAQVRHPRVEQEPIAVVGPLRARCDECACRAEDGAAGALRALFERSAEAMLVAAAGGRLVDVNQAACALLARSRDVLLTMHLTELVCDVDRPRLATVAERGDEAEQAALRQSVAGLRASWVWSASPQIRMRASL